MDPRPWASPLFRLCSSMTAGLVLFALVGLASVLGSLVPSWSGAVYGSWWFALLGAALTANTGFCTLRQVPSLARSSWRRKTLWAVHLSVLLLAVGCFWGASAFSSRTVSVREGESFEAQGGTWTLDSVTVDRYPDGMVSDWVSRGKSPSGPFEIRVNHPAEAGDEKILQSGYARDYRVRLEADGVSSVVEVPQDTEAPLTADGRVGFALSPPRDGLLAAAQEADPSLRTADLLLISQGRILQTAAVFEGVPLALGDTGLTVTVESSAARSTFLVRRTPGLWLVWTGLALLAATVTVLMLLPRKPQEEPHA